MSSLLTTDFWAKSCFIVSKLTLSSIAPSDQLTTLQALSSFLSEASPTLYGHPFAENRTIRQLYHIVMAISENQGKGDKDVSNAVDIICYNNEKMLMKADVALSGVSGASKAKNLINRALAFNAAAKRKYCETVDISLEPLPKLNGKTRGTGQGQNQDDLEFLINCRKNHIGKMNWKMCLSLGHETLRRFFYNATKNYFLYPLFSNSPLYLISLIGVGSTNSMNSTGNMKSTDSMRTVNNANKTVLWPTQLHLDIPKIGLRIKNLPLPKNINTFFDG